MLSEATNTPTSAPSFQSSSAPTPTASSQPSEAPTTTPMIQYTEQAFTKFDTDNNACASVMTDTIDCEGGAEAGKTACDAGTDGVCTAFILNTDLDTCYLFDMTSANDTLIKTCTTGVDADDHTQVLHRLSVVHVASLCAAGCCSSPPFNS